MSQRFFSILTLLIFLLLLIGTVYAKDSSLNVQKDAQVLQTTNGTTTRVSVASDGTQGNDASLYDISSISANGRYTAFGSIASNLVSGDTNNFLDVFVHDLQTNQTSRVSVASDGTQGNQWSSHPSISADGRYVVFAARANNLVVDDTGELTDIFVHDRQTGQTRRVSVASDGTQGNESASKYNSSISMDGRYVAFSSDASNLVSGDTNNAGDVFVHDLQTGQTSRVSVSSDGTQGNADSGVRSISADGRYVAFDSWASNMVTDDTNNAHDVFVHDRQTGQTSRVSIASDGNQASSGASGGSISADGRYVTFYSGSSDLVIGDTNNTGDVFVYDRQTGQTSRVSVASDGTQGNNISIHAFISADGRYVVFDSAASNLVSGDGNYYDDVFVHDRQTGQTTIVSTALGGLPANSGSGYASISADGRYVAFGSSASNLVLGDTNGYDDIFVHDRGNSASSPAPFLDLPIDYSTTTFAKAVQGNIGANGGRVNAWFDHTSPNYSVNNNLTRWNGVYSGSASVNKYRCEIQKLSCYDGHNGVDFQKRIIDEPILAAAPGIVISTTSSNSGYGNRVWVDHGNGYATLYAHLKSISVAITETVATGQQIGIMGNTGVSIGNTGIHLHFGVYFDENGDGEWTESEVVDPFGWNPLDDPTQSDPWSVPSHYLWKYPLNVQAAIDNSGGSISSVSGDTTASVPSSALSSLVTLDLWEAPPVAGASAQLRSAGFSSWLRVLEWLTDNNNMMAMSTANEFDQPVTLTIDYSEADLTHLDENQLAIHWWNTVNNEWQILSTTVNTVQKTVIAQTTQTGNFDLQAPLLCSADVREPNDNYYAANYTLADGTIWNQRFDISQDEDWFKFEAIANEMYLVETSNLASGVDTRLEVFDQDGITVLSSDDNSGEGMASYLQWVAPRDGIYFVRTTQGNSGSYGCDAAYDFSLTGPHKVYLPSIMNLP